ncbi:autotransporter outer membrane beta-barrel domain-containing protein [Entomomonas asaccharolytica]|uniref:Autotransporter outer membrane beta-barrel domain-containing protein n=1 Tax=Entomomonas asaccharolytica TaxID=2785331 RepID=A0A974NGY6_9GAMM|nr:autotransporter outer membrane beta-barrel domain-containing protein [Entomomonas asaccharolytica]QQP86274.1 autotransporter outer membrane beta-barrel domain-containing protein [Entomomonas asaccharolytica]
MKYSKVVLYSHIFFTFGLSSSVVWSDSASCTYNAVTDTNTCSGQYAVWDGSRLNYTNVVINNTGLNFGTSPDVKGVGIYASSQMTANNLTVTSSGWVATDAIRTQGNGGLTVNGKLIVKANGVSGDAINVTITSNSTVNTGDNSEIYSNSGVAVRANLSRSGNNLINVGDNAIIQTAGSGTNNSSASGYAVYAGNRDRETEGNPSGTAKVTIGNNSQISTKGNNAYAVYANKTGHIQLGSTTITTTGTSAHGIVAMDGSVTNTNNNNVVNYAGGKVDLLGDTSIIVDPTKNSLSIYASGADSVISSYNTDTSTQTAAKFYVIGDMKVDREGKIDLRMTDNSYFEGNTTITDTGSVLNLNIAGANSTWQMSKNSQVTDLSLSNYANVILGNQATAVDSSNRVVLTADNLSGNGHFQMRTDVIGTGLGANNIGDLLRVTGASSGNHLITVTDYYNGSATVDGTERLKVVETTDGNATFILKNAGQYVDIGAYKYYLGKGDTNYAEDANHWYLGAARAVPTTLTNTADRSVNILNINYLLNYAETQTLLHRMGELRQSRDNDWDFWMRGFAGRMSSFSGKFSSFDMDYHGLQAGLDRRFTINGDDLYAGIMVGTATAKADYDIGHGDTKSYHVGFYGTYKTQNDFYVDAIAKYTVMKNDFNTQTGVGYQVKGDGTTRGYTLGIETGKRFYIDQAKVGWYVEPQAQLTYSHQNSTKIHSSNGLKTKLDDFDSILGRASAIVGYSINEGKTPIDVYFKTGYVKEFDGKTGYSFNGVASTHDTYKFDGGWWDNGVGINARINKKHNVYAEVDYAKGNKFNNKSIKVGYRLEF